MDRIRTGRWLPRFATLAILVASAVAGANASPLPSYNVIDLGAGTASVQTNSNGLSVVIGPDGTVYPFPRTDNRPADVEPILDFLSPIHQRPDLRLHDLWQSPECL